MDLPFNAEGIDFRKLKLSFLSAGSTALVYTTLYEGVKVALKGPHQFLERTKDAEALARENLASLRREIEIYKHLGPHHSIIHFIAASEDQLLLAYYQKGCLTQYIRANPQPPISRLLLWAAQLADALVFIHSKDVIHADLCTNNVFVSDQDTLILGDFAGSPYCGNPGFVRYSTRYTSPRFVSQSPQQQNDIFALGSVLYEISSWGFLFPEIAFEDECKIEEAYKAGRFPDTSSYALGDVIQRCWHHKFNNAEELLNHIRKYLHH
jgi:serine/threonine protein kinase